MMTLSNLELRRRLLRLMLGALMLAIGWWGIEADGSVWAVPLRVVALYPLLTGLVGWCPMVSLWDQWANRRTGLRRQSDGEAAVNVDVEYRDHKQDEGTDEWVSKK